MTDIPCSSNINSTETIIDDWYNLNLESQGGSYHKCQSNSTSLNNYQQKTTFDTSIKIDSNEKINTKTSGFGFIKLLEISKLEPGEIFLKFNIQHKYFINLLNEDLKPDKIVVLVKCLAKLCDIKFDKSKETILAEICNSNVLKSIEKYMYSLPSTPFSEKRLNQYFWKDVEDFWHNLLRFMTEIIEILPKQAKMLLPSIINTLKNTLEDLETHHKEKISFDLYKNFIKIQENLTSTLEMVFIIYYKKLI